MAIDEQIARERVAHPERDQELVQRVLIASTWSRPGLSVRARLRALHEALDELPESPSLRRAVILDVTRAATEDWPSHARPLSTRLLRRVAQLAADEFA